MNNKSYGVLCESDNGLDEFGNAKGERMLMESIGAMLNLHEANDRARLIRESGRYGRVAVVELVVIESIF